MRGCALDLEHSRAAAFGIRPAPAPPRMKPSPPRARRVFIDADGSALADDDLKETAASLRTILSAHVQKIGSIARVEWTCRDVDAETLDGARRAAAARTGEPHFTQRNPKVFFTYSSS